MARKKLIAANWKMNPPPAGAFDKNAPFRPRGDVDVVVFPTFVDIHECLAAKLQVGPQYGRPEKNGSFTGDVSLAMCHKLGCTYALLGHSDRRNHHQETNEFVGSQVITALELGMHPLVCVGETKKERDAKHELKVVEAQMKALPLTSEITIAYEPVWAIGTGTAAALDQIQEMMRFIRSLLPAERREKTRILYGASMNPDNVKQILSDQNIDGGLIGACSLKPEEFRVLVETAATLS